jgi:hypothetical protein
VPGSPPKLLPSLIGGLFIGVLSALPFVSVLNCCCLWVITGGYIAAWLQQKNHDLPITVADGAGVGLLAGCFAGIFYYLSALLYVSLGPAVASMPDSFMRSAQDMPPEVRRMMHELGPQGLLLVGSLFFWCIALVFGTIGGVLGGVMIRKPSPPPPPVPPVRWGAPPPSSFPGAGSPGARPSEPWPPPPPPPGDEKPPE